MGLKVNNVAKNTAFVSQKQPSALVSLVSLSVFKHGLMCGLIVISGMTGPPTEGMVFNNKDPIFQYALRTGFFTPA